MFKSTGVLMLGVLAVARAQDEATEEVVATEEAVVDETPKAEEPAAEVDDFVDPMDDDDDDEDIDFSDIEAEMAAEASLDMEWDESLSEPMKKERMQMCLHTVRTSFNANHPGLLEVVEGLMAQGATKDEAMNHFMFQMLTICYKQLGEDQIDKLRTANSFTEEDRQATFMRKEDTPMHLSKKQSDMLTVVIEEDQRNAQAQQQQQTMSDPEPIAPVWYLYILAIFAMLFTVGALIIRHLQHVEATSSKNFKPKDQSRKSRRLKAA